MEWKQHHTNLNKILAGIVPFKKEAYQIAIQADLNASQIAFDDKASTNWFGIIREAILENKVTQLIDAVIEQYGEIQILVEARKGTLDALIPTNDPSDDVDWADRSDNLDFQLEKIIGRESTLLPIHFLEKGLKVAKSVCKVVTPRGSGTGFLIRDNVLVTNNHVLPNQSISQESHLLFNFQKGLEGVDLAFEKIDLDSKSYFKTNEADDWTAIKVIGDQNAKWGAISFGTSELYKNQRVSIIQHPGGGQKQIAMHHNYIRHFDDRIVQYLTDTMPGSSGSPVFDEQWNVIALHHAGGYLRDPGTKKMVFRNQGIRIGRITF